MLAEESMSTRIAKRRDVTVLSVSGEIDMLTSPAFKAAILEALSESPPALVIDLSEVTFFSSAAISILVAAYDGMGSGYRFAVAAAGPVTGRILEILELKELLTVRNSLDAALAAVEA